MLIPTFIANITDFVLVDRGSIPDQDSAIFLCSTASRSALGPSTFLYDGHQGVLSVGVKLLGRDANLSTLSSVEVKEWWGYTSIPPYVSMARCLIKHGGKFTLT
jgi:hypothetical protein